jgi:hypothetical protein
MGSLICRIIHLVDNGIAHLKSRKQQSEKQVAILLNGFLYDMGCDRRWRNDADGIIFTTSIIVTVITHLYLLTLTAWKEGNKIGNVRHK